MFESQTVSMDKLNHILHENELLKKQNSNLLAELEKAYETIVFQLKQTEDEKSIVYKQLRKEIKRYRTLFLGTLTSLTYAIDAKDHYTSGHSARVAQLSKFFGQELGYQGFTLENLEYAALLHDIGKIGISEKILLKKGKLKRNEKNEMDLHPVISAQILEPIRVFEEILPIVKHHHERYDGNGYPDKLKGDEIPIGARILSISDALDAMTTNRCYRKSLPVSIVMKELKQHSGKQFSPDLVSIFFKLYEWDKNFKEAVNGKQRSQLYLSRLPK